MNFFKFLRLNLFFFQLCGFYPQQIVRTKRSIMNTGIIWTILNSILISVQTIVVFYNYNFIFERPILLGKVVDMFKYACLTLTCIVILIESILAVDDEKSVWEMSWKLQKSFQKILPPSTKALQNRLFKKNLLKTYPVAIGFISVQIYLALQRKCIFCSLYATLAFYAINKYLHYILYVDIIHQQVVNLGCEFERLIVHSTLLRNHKLNDDGKSKVEMFLVRKLKIASAFYVNLYDMSVRVNSAFGWSLVFNLVLSYIQIFVDFFWMYQLFVNNGEEFLVGK